MSEKERLEAGSLKRIRVFYCQYFDYKEDDLYTPEYNAKRIIAEMDHLIRVHGWTPEAIRELHKACKAYALEKLAREGL